MGLNRSDINKKIRREKWRNWIKSRIQVCLKDTTINQEIKDLDGILTKMLMDVESIYATRNHRYAKMLFSIMESEINSLKKLIGLKYPKLLQRILNIKNHLTVLEGLIL